MVSLQCPWVKIGRIDVLQYLAKQLGGTAEAAEKGHL